MEMRLRSEMDLTGWMVPSDASNTRWVCEPEPSGQRWCKMQDQFGNVWLLKNQLGKFVVCFRRSYMTARPVYVKAVMEDGKGVRTQSVRECSGALQFEDLEEAVLLAEKCGGMRLGPDGRPWNFYVSAVEDQEGV